MKKLPILSILFLLLSVVSFPSVAGELVLYIAATGSSDGNSGLEPGSPIRTLDKALSILNAKRVAGELNRDVRISIKGGNYYCRELSDEWNFFNPPYKLTIEGINNPVFHGHNQDGVKCAKGVWMLVRHGKINTGLTIKGLKITKYKGAITIIGSDEPTSVKANISITNNIFEKLGDLHYSSNSAGKGAILLTRTNGNFITNNTFTDIENIYDNRGLIHAVYFTSEAKGNLVQNNNFVNVSGSTIKITDFSNNNVIINNSFTKTTTAIVDRWCGARTEDDISKCPGGMPQCPSWGTVIDTQTEQYKNVFLSEVSQAYGIYKVPAGQLCRFNPLSTFRYTTIYTP